MRDQALGTSPLAGTPDDIVGATFVVVCNDGAPVGCTLLGVTNTNPVSFCFGRCMNRFRERTTIAGADEEVMATFGGCGVVVGHAFGVGVGHAFGVGGVVDHAVVGFGGNVVDHDLGVGVAVGVNVVEAVEYFTDVEGGVTKIGISL